jgi:type III pantothenate kinase
LIAAHAQANGVAIVAGCGTALTLDAINAQGQHLGGLIAPSPDLMQAALHGRTARLGTPAEGKVVAMADNTVDAVTSGAWLAAVSLTKRFVANAAEALVQAPTLLLTGGGAARLSTLIRAPHRVDEELVLRGLALRADAVG